MDLVRCQLDDSLDVNLSFVFKDANGNHYFRIHHRYCLRLKDTSAVVLLAYLDRQPA
jgi:hypothetical protein